MNTSILEEVNNKIKAIKRMDTDSEIPPIFSEDLRLRLPARRDEPSFLLTPVRQALQAHQSAAKSLDNLNNSKSWSRLKGAVGV